MEDPPLPAARPKYSTTVTDTPKFDLTSYISNYRGRTIFRRLYLIASCSTVLREEAARLAVLEAKRGNDVQNYLDAISLLTKIGKGSRPDSQVDKAWVERTQKLNEAETTRLNHELKGYKNNLIKESIRMGNEDLGAHYHAIGDLPNATKAYSAMREYCTTPSHIASTAFRIIAVSIEQDNWLAVQSQVHKIRNLQMKPDDTARTQPKSSSAMGLQQMAAGDYHDAAMSFLNTDPNLGDQYNDILTSNDVAVYGGLCALASMSRSELQTKVLDNAGFRNFLELEPHIRRAISFFCSSKYSQCLEILEAYRVDYLLDIYLRNQVHAIYEQVRTKSIVEYLRPFSRVTLDSMQGMFGQAIQTNGSMTNGASNGAATTRNIEDELIKMIEGGILSAKIDLESRVLIANEENERAQTHEQTLKMMDRFIREARLKILRMAAVNAGLEVKPPPGKKGWVGANPGGGLMDDLAGPGNGSVGGWTNHDMDSFPLLRGGRGKGVGDASVKGKGKMV